VIGYWHHNVVCLSVCLSVCDAVRYILEQKCLNKWIGSVLLGRRWCTFKFQPPIDRPWILKLSTLKNFQRSTIGSLSNSWASFYIGLDRLPEESFSAFVIINAAATAKERADLKAYTTTELPIWCCDEQEPVAWLFFRWSVRTVRWIVYRVLSSNSIIRFVVALLYSKSTTNPKQIEVMEFALYLADIRILRDVYI